MTVRELNKKQLNELKQNYATQLVECGKDEVSGISYDELIESENISDEVIFNHYDGINFTSEDFFCNC